MNNIHPWLRGIFLVGILLSLLAGIQLYLLSARTDVYFSWTIQSALTAATFGAFYFGTVTFGLLAIREKVWAHVRGPAVGLFAFLFVTMAATILHLDKFHFGSENILTLISTWLWMSIYTLLPFVQLVALILQGRMPRSDPEPTSNLPGWIRILLWVHGIAGIVIALLLFFIPQLIIPAWPWPLTPLTARALAAWLVSFGILDLQMVRENDWSRAHIMSVGYSVLAPLALIALLRYASEVRWTAVGAVLYLLYLAVMLVVGVTGFFRTRSS